MSFYKSDASAVIANGTSLAAAVNLGAGRLAGIQMPAAWDAANLTFQVSQDGVTYQNLYDATGAEIVVTAAAARYIALNQQLWTGINFLKVRSGTSVTPVNQTAARSVVLIATPLYPI